MSVQAFLARLCHLNDLDEHMPIPMEGGDDDDRVPKFLELELSIILHKSCPCSWCDAQVSADFRYLSLTAQANSFSSLKNLEDNKPTAGMVKVITTIIKVIDKTITIDQVTSTTIAATTTIAIIIIIIILASNIAVFMVTAPVPAKNVYW
jgi:hypothetical protein